MLFVLLLCICSSGVLASARAPESSNQYVFALLKSLPYEPSKNLVISPLGIKFCLLALAAGDDRVEQRTAIGKFLFPNQSATPSEGDFLAEGRKLVSQLHQPPPPPDTSEANLEHEGSRRASRVNQANHNYMYTFLFMSNRAQVTDGGVLKSLEDSLSLKPFKVDYGNLAHEQRNFNDFFKSNLPTYRGDPPHVSSNPQLMNIIVFIRNWKKKFHTEGKLNFQTADHQQVQVDKMIGTLDIEVGRTGLQRATFASIPYLDDQYRFVIILPDSSLTVAQFIDRFPPGELDTFLRRLHEKESLRRSMVIQMPPFRITQDLELSKVLAGHLPGVSQLNMGHISPLLNDLQSSQLSLIEVSEEGTFAQALTRFESRAGWFAEPDDKLILNRPFLYALVGRVSNEASNKPKYEVLFAGYVNNPK